MREPEGRVDVTTGFGDRVSLEIAARAELARTARAGHVLSIVVIRLVDADDVVVRDGSISLALRGSVRASDLLFRSDVDTIVALLPTTEALGVSKVMQRVARLADRPFSYAVATAPVDGRHLDSLLDEASRRTEHVTF